MHQTSLHCTRTRIQIYGCKLRGGWTLRFSSPDVSDPAAEGTGGEAEDDNGYAPEEEAQVEFQPLVKLDEVKVTTGEDDEAGLRRC